MRLFRFAKDGESFGWDWSYCWCCISGTIAREERLKSTDETTIPSYDDVGIGCKSRDLIGCGGDKLFRP